MRARSTPKSARIADELHSATIHLLRRLRRVDAASGTSPARLSALSVLVYGGARTLGQLAVAEQVKAPTMSRLVTGMEADGLVLREPDPLDGRVVHLRASAKGKRLLEGARGERLALLGALIATLTKEEQAQLGQAAALLQRVAVATLEEAV
jgi:DNA-binding MarR family transcriptional regulator